MSLFWYPDREHKACIDKPFDKDALVHDYIIYYLDRLQSMFKYDGLPDTIPAKWLENYLLTNGSCVFIKDGEDLIVTTGGWGGIPDRYFVPTEYIVANPYVKEETRRTYTIGEDCVIIRNDTYARGVLGILYRYINQLVDNDITMQTSDILARAMLMFTATNDRDRESIDLWLKKLRKGELAAMGELPSMVGNQDRSINITPFKEVAGIFTDLIEYHQYLKAGLFNELGLNSNYNMKRESINSNESQLNDDMLHPLIDNMLAMRKEALEQVNDMFGTNISVKFNSAWEDNEIENNVLINSIEQATEEAPAEETPAEETPAEEAPAEETPAEEEPTSDTDIVDAIEDVAAAIEGLAGDKEDDTEEDKEGDDNAENNT